MNASLFHPQIQTHGLVIASHNPGKIIEIQDLLSPFGFPLENAKELGLEEPEETGQTFIENAEIKAKTIAEACQKPALADDSGLVIDALDGAPGVYSARWAQTPEGSRDFVMAIGKIQTLLEAKGCPLSDPLSLSATMVCALTLALPNGICQSFEGKVQGTLQFPCRGQQGFGYDALFQPLGSTQTFAEMTPLIKQRLSHRWVAFQQLTRFLSLTR